MATNKRKSPTAKDLVESLIISIGEARKKLGAEADNMSDDEVAMLILELHELAPDLLKFAHSSL